MDDRYELLWDPEGETVSIPKDEPVDVLLYETGPEPLSYSHPSTIAQDARDSPGRYRTVVSFQQDDGDILYDLSLRKFESMFKEPLPINSHHPARFQYRVELCDSREDLEAVKRIQVREQDDQPYIH